MRGFDILIDMFEAHLQVIMDKYLELKCVCSLAVKMVDVIFLKCQLKKINKDHLVWQKRLKCLNEPGMTRKAVREKFDLSESTWIY